MEVRRPESAIQNQNLVTRTSDGQDTDTVRRRDRRWSRSSCPMVPSKIIPKGSVREVAAGIGKRLADAAVAAVAQGQVVDLDRPLENGDDAPIEMRILTPKDREALDVLRHSTAHIMARAIMRTFPGVRLAFGPTTTTGFYYDIEIPGRSLSEDDFPAIEAEMARY